MGRFPNVKSCKAIVKVKGKVAMTQLNLFPLDSHFYLDFRNSPIFAFYPFPQSQAQSTFYDTTYFALIHSFCLHNLARCGLVGA